MKIVKRIFEIIVSFFISFIIFYNITSEFISFFYQGSFKFEQILYVLIYFGQSVLIYFFIQFIFKENITQKQINLIWCLYFCVMLILLFGRPYIGLAINLNPLTILEFNYYSFFQNLFNLFLFIPIGFIFKKNNSKIRVLIIAILIVLAIETLQLITMRGIFDIVDILLDATGIFIGFLISPYVPQNLKFSLFNL